MGESTFALALLAAACAGQNICDSYIQRVWNVEVTMARGRIGGSGNPILVIVMLIMLIVAATTPFILFIGYAYYRFKLKENIRSISNSKSDFWLNTEEKRLFKKYSEQLPSAKEIIVKATNKGIKAGISTNLDGSFSARSNLGKEIRATLAQYQPICDQASDELNAIATAPLNKWEALNKYAQRAFAFFWALCCWVISFTVTTSVYYTPQISFEDNFMRVAVAPAVIAICSFFIVYFAAKNRGNNFSPKPSIVSLENVDSY